MVALVLHAVLHVVQVVWEPLSLLVAPDVLQPALGTVLVLVLVVVREPLSLLVVQDVLPLVLAVAQLDVIQLVKIPQNQLLVLIVAAIAQAHVTIHVKQAAAEHAIGRVEEVAIIVVQEIV